MVLQLRILTTRVFVSFKLRLAEKISFLIPYIQASEYRSLYWCDDIQKLWSLYILLTAHLEREQGRLQRWARPYMLFFLVLDNEVLKKTRVTSDQHQYPMQDSPFRR